MDRGDRGPAGAFDSSLTSVLDVLDVAEVLRRQATGTFLLAEAGLLDERPARSVAAALGHLARSDGATLRRLLRSAT